MEFDTPIRLQQRILEAAGELSEDVSLPGLARRAPSAASESFTSLDQSQSRSQSDLQQESGTNRQSHVLPSFNFSGRGGQGGAVLDVGKDSTNQMRSSSIDISMDRFEDREKNDQTRRISNGKAGLTLQSALENQKGRDGGRSSSGARSGSGSSSTNKDTRTTAIRLKHDSNRNAKANSISLSRSQRLALSRSNPLDRSTDTNSDLGASISAANNNNNNNNINNNANHSISLPQSSTPQSNNITRSLIDGIGNTGKPRDGSRGSSNYTDRIRESLAKKPKQIGSMVSPGGITKKSMGSLGAGSPSRTARAGLSNSDSWKTGTEGLRSERQEQEGHDQLKSTREPNSNTGSSEWHKVSVSEEQGGKPPVEQQTRDNSSPHPDASTTSSFISTSFERRPDNQRRISEVSNQDSDHGSRTGTTSTRTMHTSDIAPSFDVRNARHPVPPASDRYEEISRNQGNEDEAVLREGLGRRSGASGQNPETEVSKTYENDEEDHNRDGGDGEEMSNERLDDDELTQDRCGEREDLAQNTSIYDEDRRQEEMNQRSETTDTYTRDLSTSNAADVTPALSQNANNGRKNFGIRISPGRGNQTRRDGASPTPSPEGTNRSASAMGMTTATKTPRARVDGDKMREHLLSTLKYTDPIAQSRRFRQGDGASIGKTPRVRNKFNLESNETNSFSSPGVSTSPIRARIRALANENQHQSTTPATVKNSRIQSLVREDFADAISYASSESSNDLTVPARMKGIRRGNTSLPDGIANTPSNHHLMGPSLANVDPIRMGTYQNQIHKQLQSRLEETLDINREQAERIKDLETDWNKALREIELLKRSSGSNRPGSEARADKDQISSVSSSSENGKKAGGVGEETYQEIEFDLKSKDQRIEELEADLKESTQMNLNLEDEADKIFQEAQKMKQERDDLLVRLKEAAEAREGVALADSRSRLAKSRSSNHNNDSPEREDDSQLLSEAGKEELEKELNELSEAYDELFSKYEKLTGSHEEGISRLKKEVEKEFKALEERLNGEIQLSQSQILSLKEDLQISEKKVERLQEEREALIESNADGAKDAEGNESKIFGLNDRISELEAENNHLKQDLRQTQSDLDNLEKDLRVANTDLDTYELDFQELSAELKARTLQLQECQEEVEELKDERDGLMENADLRYKQLEVRFNDLLEESEAKDQKLTEEIKELKEELIEFEDKLKASLTPQSKSAIISSSTEECQQESRVAANSSVFDSQGDAALQKELDEAHQEIGKLNHQIQMEIAKQANGSPSENISDTEREAEISRLRFEVEMLNHKLNGLKDQHLSYSNVGNDSQATPKKNHYQHKNIRDLKSSPVKTPMRSSGALNEISWLNHDSLAETSTVGRIQMLQAELGLLNADIDMKLDNWPRAKAIEMEAKLSFAEKRISELELELAELRRTRSNIRFSTSSKSNSNAFTKSSSEQNLAYQKVVNELLELKSNWEDDIDRFNKQKIEMERVKVGLQNENDAMAREVENQKERERVHKMNAKKATEMVHQVRQPYERIRLESKMRKPASTGRRENTDAPPTSDSVRQQLERARKVTKAFEYELKERRLHLESLDTRSKEALRSRSEIQIRLAKTESEFSEIQTSLVEKQRRYVQLDTRLLECSRGAGEVHIELSKLSNEISETKLQIEVLKSTKSKILDEKTDLKDDYQRIQIESQNRFEELKIAKEAMFAHQAQLDDQVLSIESLHNALDERNRELERTSDEKDKLTHERKEILKEVQSLYDTLIRLREDGGELSMEMLRLKDERDMWRRKEIEMRELVQKLRQQASKVSHHEGQGDAAALVQRHAAECKGLMLQIRYLKTKFMRESDLRSDLSHQKTYLLQLVGGLELSEAATAQFIADIGISRGTITPDQTLGRRFRKVAIAVRGVVRMRLMAQRWRGTLETRNALREAHEANVRSRRPKIGS